MAGEHALFGESPPGDFEVSLGDGKKLNWHAAGRAWTLHGHRPDGSPMVDTHLDDRSLVRFEIEPEGVTPEAERAL